MKKTILACFLIFIYSTVFTQTAPGIQWQKVLGGMVTDYRTYSVDSALDGGYIIAGAYGYGYNLSAPAAQSPYTDGFLAKFDASGTLVWKKTYDAYRNDGLTLQNNYNIFNSVKHTADGGYIAVGNLTSAYSEPSAYVVKTNSTGDTLWERVFQPTVGASFNSVKQTADGGYIIAGSKNLPSGDRAEDYYIVKLDASGNTVWEKSYGGSETDIANSVSQATDGGYIIAGYTGSGYYIQTDGDVSGNHCYGQASASNDIWLVKLDASGNLTWQKCLGGTATEYGNAVNVTSDGSYIVGGYSNSTDGDVTANKGLYDYWVIKVTSTGSITWQKTYGGSQSDFLDDIKQTTDGGYIATGYASSADGDVTGHHSGTVVHADAWTLKLDNTGNLTWQNSTGTVNSEGGKSVIQTSSGFVIAGTNNSKNYNSSGYTSGDYWIFKLNTAGSSVLWQDVAGASGGYNAGRSIAQASDGGFVTAGYGNSNNTNITGSHGGFDGIIFKTDNTGALQWSKSIGGLFDDYISSIIKTSDGGYIAAGTSNSSDGDVTTNKGNSDYWVVKLTSAGAITWQKTYGGSGFDSATSIIQTKDGGYIVAGRSTSNNDDVSGNHGDYDYWIIKIDATGNLTWQKSYGGTGSDYPYSIKQTSDGGYVVGGRSSSADGNVTGNHGGFDYWIIKLDASGNLSWQKSYGGSSDDDCYSIYVADDGNILTAGYASSTDGDVTGLHGVYSYPDFWIVKLKSDGTLVWEKTFGSSDYEEAFSIIQSNDGKYVAAGFSGTVYALANDGDVTGNHGGNDVWIIKTDTSGNLLWEKSYGGTHDETGISIIQATDGSYAIAGITDSNDGDVSGNPSSASTNVWVLKLAADVLPVSLLNFDGVIKDNNALLSWRTANESNNKGFEVQKSYDGRSFTDIGFVNGVGNSSVIKNYNYNDVKVVNGSNYYRLKQEDFDGRFNYSNVIKLDYSKFAWSILGNPVKNSAVVELQLDKDANVSMQLLSINGNVLATINKGKISAGTYSVPVNVSKLAAGNYFIKLLVDVKQYTAKIVKQ